MQIAVEGCYVHDPSAVIRAVSPGLFTLREGPVTVALDGPAAGQTLQRPVDSPLPPLDWDRPPPQRVAVAVDATAVRRALVDTLLAQG